MGTVIVSPASPIPCPIVKVGEVEPPKALKFSRGFIWELNLDVDGDADNRRCLFIIFWTSPILTLPFPLTSTQSSMVFIPRNMLMADCTSAILTVPSPSQSPGTSPKIVTVPFEPLTMTPPPDESEPEAVVVNVVKPIGALF